jgi:hypothetical protein
MREALEALNRLVEDGVISAYAIGGAIAAAFYIEAMQTEDIDAFTVIPPSGSALVSLTAVYDALTAMGGIVDGGYVRFGEWPLQILSDGNPLVAEAIAEAEQVEYQSVPARVFRAEYLCAIALQTGRMKDYLRVNMFQEQHAVNVDKLLALVERFGLRDRLAKLSSLPDGG